MLVSLHSFTPVYAGVARPWHIATLYQRDTTLPPLLLQAFRAEGDLVVGDNEPYAVNDATDYTIPVHGEARGLINTGIEIRQDLIADQSGQQQWAERLARIFREIEATLRGGMSARDHPVGKRSSRATRRVSASQMPPPIMKPPEMRDTSRVRRAEKSVRARPASSA